MGMDEPLHQSASLSVCFSNFLLLFFKLICNQNFTQNVDYWFNLNISLRLVNPSVAFYSPDFCPEMEILFNNWRWSPCR